MIRFGDDRCYFQSRQLTIVQTDGPDEFVSFLASPRRGTINRDNFRHPEKHTHTHTHTHTCVFQCSFINAENYSDFIGLGVDESAYYAFWMAKSKFGRRKRRNIYRHAAPLATKPGKALGRKTIFLADSAFRTAGKITFSPVMSVFYLRQVLPR